jgi:hypothetical protein
MFFEKAGGADATHAHIRTGTAGCAPSIAPPAKHEWFEEAGAASIGAFGKLRDLLVIFAVNDAKDQITYKIFTR